MWAGRSRGYGALVLGLILLHFLLRPLLIGWPGAPDLLAGGLLLAALRLRAGWAAALGFVLGLLEGAMALEGMGSLMVVYTATGYLAARSRDLIFTDARVFLPLFLFLGVWAVQVAVGAAAGLPPGEAAVLGAPLTAVTTALVCWAGVRLVSPLGF